MRTWLFYKAREVRAGEFIVEFAKFDSGGHLGTHLPAPMARECEFKVGAETLERSIERFIRSCQWVGPSATRADSEVGQAVIGKRIWPHPTAVFQVRATHG